MYKTPDSRESSIYTLIVNQLRHFMNKNTDKNTDKKCAI